MKNKNTVKTIALAPYPDVDDAVRSPIDESNFSMIMSIINAVRAIRNKHRVPQNANVSLTIHCPDATQRSLLDSEGRFIEALVRVDGHICIGTSDDVCPQNTLHDVVTSPIGNIELFVGLMDVNRKAERERIEREMKRVAKELATIERRIDHVEFVKKAPCDIVSRAFKQKESLEKKIKDLQIDLQNG